MPSARIIDAIGLMLQDQRARRALDLEEENMRLRAALDQETNRLTGDRNRLMHLDRQDALALRERTAQQKTEAGRLGQSAWAAYADILAGGDGESFTTEDLGGAMGPTPVQPQRRAGGAEPFGDPRFLSAFSQAPPDAQKAIVSAEDLRRMRTGTLGQGEQRLQIQHQRLAAAERWRQVRLSTDKERLDIARANSETYRRLVDLKTPTEADAAVVEAELNFKRALAIANADIMNELMLGPQEGETEESFTARIRTAQELRWNEHLSTAIQNVRKATEKQVELRRGPGPERSAGDEDLVPAPAPSRRPAPASAPANPPNPLANPRPTPQEQDAGASREADKGRLRDLMLSHPRRPHETEERYRARIRTLFERSP